MTSKEFKKVITKAGFSIVNEFKNEHEENFIILKHKSLKGYFIAGDETDWEVLTLHSSGEYAYTEFRFAEKEASTIKKVLELDKK